MQNIRQHPIILYSKIPPTKFGLLPPLNFNLTSLPSESIDSFGELCPPSPNRENPWHPRPYLTFSICLLQAIMVWEKLKVCSVFRLEAKAIFSETFRQDKKPDYA